MPASSRRGRVTPKGSRPPGTSARRPDRPDAMLGRYVVRNGRAPQAPQPRQPVARTPVVRTGHRPGR